MKRVLACVLVLVGFGLMTSGAHAAGGGVEITAQGWWSRLQSKSLPTPAPPPPNVKPGQLDVQGGPTGVIAMAAFRATLGPDGTNPVLTLAVASDTGGASAILLACQTGSAWTPVENGDFADAPHVETSKCVSARRSADGKTFTVPLGSLQFGTNLDVVLVPGTDPTLPEGANGSTFQLVFDKLTAGAIVTTPGTPPPVPATSPAPAGASGLAPGPGTFGPRTPVLAPVAPTPAVPVDKAGATATSPVQQAATAPQVAISAAAAERAGTRWFGAAVVAIGVALALWARREDNLGRLAALRGEAMVAADRGLGRFVRPRTGLPPPLS